MRGYRRNSNRFSELHDRRRWEDDNPGWPQRPIHAPAASGPTGGLPLTPTLTPQAGRGSSVAEVLGADFETVIERHCTSACCRCGRASSGRAAAIRSSPCGSLPTGIVLTCAGRRVEHVDDVVVAPGQPQLPAVGADVAHVGAAAARDRPVSSTLRVAKSITETLPLPCGAPPWIASRDWRRRASCRRGSDRGRACPCRSG